MKWRSVGWIAPVVVFVATFGVFAARHPSSVKALVTSPRGVSTVALMAVVGGVVLLGFRRIRLLRPATPFALTAVIAACAVFADVPFERHSTENRRLVQEVVVDAPANPTATTATTATTAAAPSVAQSTVTTIAAAPIAAALMAVRRSSAALHGINHSASGDVSIVESAAGDFVVRFEHFKVQGAPGSVLYVVEGADVREPGGTKLGPFTATEGTTLDVALPPGVRPGPGWTVLIWCERFATPIANATQVAT